MSSPVVTYRAIEERDFPEIVRMYELLNNFYHDHEVRLPKPEHVGEIWLDTFRRTLGRFSYVLVAELDGRLMGFMLSRIKRLPPYMGGVLVGELSDMWVEPEARRLKIGNQLSRISLRWLRDQKVHSVEIQVLMSNEASWNLLAELGFKAEFRVGRLFWEEFVDTDRS